MLIVPFDSDSSGTDLPVHEVTIILSFVLITSRYSIFWHIGTVQFFLFAEKYIVAYFLFSDSILGIKIVHENS
jgi:hypothetical protein